MVQDINAYRTVFRANIAAPAIIRIKNNMVGFCFRRFGLRDVIGHGSHRANRAPGPLVKRNPKDDRN